MNSKDSAKPSKSLAKNMKDTNDNKYKIRLSNIGLKSLWEFLEDYQNISRENQSIYGQSIDLDIVRQTSIFDVHDQITEQKSLNIDVKSSKLSEWNAINIEKPELYKHGK